MERISSPRKIITRSLPAAISIIPTVANSSSVWNSPAGSPSHSTQIIETSTVSAAPQPDGGRGRRGEPGERDSAGHPALAQPPREGVHHHDDDARDREYQL